MLVGLLLHDLDYDMVKNDMKMHSVVAAEMLKGKLPKKCIYAIKAHDYRSGFKPKSKLDKASIATDSLASLIEKMGMKIEKIRWKSCEQRWKIFPPATHGTKVTC